MGGTCVCLTLLDFRSQNRPREPFLFTNPFLVLLARKLPRILPQVLQACSTAGSRGVFIKTQPIYRKWIPRHEGRVRARSCLPSILAWTERSLASFVPAAKRSRNTRVTEPEELV
jgi:hypothetical protein